MKILRITSLGYESGGAENGIVLMQPHLEEKGYTVKTISSDQGKEDYPLFSDYTFPSITTKPFFIRALYRLWNPDSYKAVKKVLKEYKPDIVQLHTMYEVSPSVLFLLKKYPTIATVHGVEDYTKHFLIYSFPKKLFKKGREASSKQNLNIMGHLHYLFHVLCIRPIYLIGLGNVDAFLVMSTYMKDMLQREGIEARVIKNATELFDPAPHTDNAPHIVYVGRLEKIKGVQYALRALKEVSESVRDVHMTIVGEGDYKENLERLTVELGLGEKVLFAGHKNRTEVEQVYKNASLIVMPSLWPEPFGKVGIEAMSVGRPVIASDVGGISEWLKNGENGFLVNPANTKELAEKITLCLTDKDLYTKFSEQAILNAKSFSIEQYTRHIDALYIEVFHSST